MLLEENSRTKRKEIGPPSRTGSLVLAYRATSSRLMILGCFTAFACATRRKEKRKPRQVFARAVAHGDAIALDP